MTSEQARTEPAYLRQQRIRSIVDGAPFVRTSDLAERLGVTPVTIRADLDELASAGHVRRVRGGAIGQTAGESVYETTEREAPAAKAAMAIAAVDLIESGQTILLDAGTTSTAIAQRLAVSDLDDVTVVTNNLKAAYELRAASRMQVIVSGGALRVQQHSLVEPLSTVVFERIRADIAFLGCTGISVADGVTNVNLPEAQVKVAMLRASRRHVVVAHAAKVGRTHTAVVCGLDDVDVLVTDADRAATDPIAEAGVEVVAVVPRDR